MKILALETCLGAVSVAVATAAGPGHGPTRIEADALDMRQTGHAEHLLPMVAAVMARAHMDFAALDRVAVTLGPGTFTGVRTGVAAARAFRLALGVEIVGTTSLAVMAERVRAAPGGDGDTPLLVAVDARRDRVFAQLFGRHALQPLTAAVEARPAEAALIAGEARFLVAGSASLMVAEAAAAMGLRTEIVAGESVPRAADLARMAPGLPALAQVSPVYIRAPDAKPQAGKRVARAP